LKAEDVDGAENGSYRKLEIPVKFTSEPKGGAGMYTADLGDVGLMTKEE